MNKFHIYNLIIKLSEKNKLKLRKKYYLCKNKIKMQKKN